MSLQLLLVCSFQQLFGPIPHIVDRRYHKYWAAHEKPSKAITITYPDVPFSKRGRHHAGPPWEVNLSQRRF